MDSFLNNYNSLKSVFGKNSRRFGVRASTEQYDHYISMMAKADVPYKLRNVLIS